MDWAHVRLILIVVSLHCSYISGVVFNVSDYGGYPNDNLDDSNATYAAIYLAMNNGPNNVVMFQAGTYDLSTHIYLSNAVNLTITGQGQDVTKLLGHAATAIFMVINSTGVKISMLSIDFVSLPFTAGYVVNVQPTYLEMQVVPPHTADVGRRVQAILRYDPLLMRPAIGSKAYEVYQLPPPNVNTSLGTNGVLRVPLSSPWSFAVGDAIIVRFAFTIHAFYGLDIPDFTLQSITIYTAWSMGVFLLRAPRLNINDYHVKRSAGRWMSTAADCMHFADSREYINIYDSSCEAQGDDGLNVKVYYFQVAQVVNSSALIIQQYNFQETLNVGTGTRMELSTGQKPFSAYATAVVASISNYNATAKLFTFTNAVNVTVLDWVCVADTPVVTIRNLTVANNRARGVLLEARNVNLTQSLFNRTSGPAVLINPSLYWHEGPAAANISLEYNMYINCNEGLTRENGMITLAPNPVQLAPVIFQIRIKSSTFIHSIYSAHVIEVANAANVWITDNYIATTNSSAPVLLCNSKNISASNNCISNNQTAISQFYLYDTTSPCANNLSSQISLLPAAFNSSFPPPVIATNSGVQLNVAQTSTVIASSITTITSGNTGSTTPAPSSTLGLSTGGPASVGASGMTGSMAATAALSTGGPTSVGTSGVTGSTSTPVVPNTAGSSTTTVASTTPRPTSMGVSSTAGSTVSTTSSASTASQSRNVSRNAAARITWFYAFGRNTNAFNYFVVEMPSILLSYAMFFYCIRINLHY